MNESTQPAPLGAEECPFTEWITPDNGPELTEPVTDGIPGRKSAFVEVQDSLGGIHEARYQVRWSVDNSFYRWTDRTGRIINGVKRWRALAEPKEAEAEPAPTALSAVETIAHLLNCLDASYQCQVRDAAFVRRQKATIEARDAELAAEREVKGELISSLSDLQGIAALHLKSLPSHWHGETELNLSDAVDEANALIEKLQGGAL